MATYFQGNSEIQADGLQTLYLMNPSYIGYPDTPQPPIPTNMVFLSSTGNTLNPASLSQSGQTHNQQLVGIPLQPTHPSSQQYPIRPTSNQQEIPVLHGFSPVQYKLWSSMDQQIPSPSVTGNSSVGATDYTSQLGLRRSSVVQQAQQGLSLSLSPQQTVHRQTESGNPIPVSESITALASGNEMRVSGGSSSSAVSIGTSNIQSALLGSKYLKVTQQLLDEVVNVGNGIKTELSKGIDNNNKGQILMNKDQSNSLTGEGSSIGGGGDASVGKETELSTGERQELQMKKAKLVTMLDEVGERYKQYYQQMQIVVSSFEQAAGFGSAKTYTALALQTISKQFRCLKDAISAQIRATGKNLGEEDFLIGGKVEGSRLRFFDHQIRQQRALQQLGMIQQNAWRPQRGLPERSVSILRAWLFEHFLHPYPKDSDKLMLAKQTGLTRSQVSNWFINARVRLWKPMVEEMYMEETKDQEHKEFEDKSDKNKPNETSGSKSTEHSPNSADQTRNLISKQDKPTGSDVGPSVSNSTILTSIIEENIRTQASGFFLGGTSNGEEILQGNAKKQRNELQNFGNQSMDMEIKSGETNRELCMNFGSERQDRNGYSMITNAGNHGGGFGTYNHQIGEEIGRFDHDQYPPRFSNGFSLTLGLPHCENLSLSGTQQTYLSNQNIQFGKRLEMGIGNEPDEFGGVNPPLSHSKTPYENINMENRKRFSAQLLPDFVT